MPYEPQISFDQALEVFQGQISVKVHGCPVAQNIVPGSNFLLWAMPDEPQISFGQALEVFQGHIGVKLTCPHVSQNMVCCSNFFCGLCLMSLKSVSVKLWRSSKAI